MAQVMICREELKQLARDGDLPVHALAALLEALEHDDTGRRIDIACPQSQHLGDARACVGES